MAGTIITDKIQTENSFLTLNVGATQIATMNTSGIYSSSGNKMLGADGSIGNSTISGATITSSTVSGNLNFDSTGTSGIRLPAANTLSFHTAGTEDMRIDSSGNVGIGISNSTDKLTIAHADEKGITFKATGADGVTAAQILYEDTNGGTGGVFRFDHDVNSFTFATAGTTERMRIDSSGRLLVGFTSWAGGATNAGVAIKATSTSSSIFAFYVDNSSSNIFNIRCDGSTYNTTGVWGTISDQHLKENIVDATPKLDNLLQLKVRNFNFTGDENKTKQIGFVAQEIEQVFPSLVSEDAEGTKAVKTTVLLPMLVKAIQEQQTIIADLKARIEVLEAQ